jgi:DNA-directed RNA polymerase specialized sigma subunit
MTAKTYLQQAYRLDAKIKNKRQKLKRWQILSVSVSPNSDSPRNNGDVSDKVGKLVAKIVDLQVEMFDDLEKYICLQEEIEERLNSMPDDDLRLILEMRYLNFQKWSDIAEELGFSIQWVHVLHKRALKNFSDTLD